MREPNSCSELESLVLAMIGRGVSSGYAMRKFLLRLRSGRWSSESGSVYRVLRRLADGGLIEVSGVAGAPNRRRTEYALTPQGSERLREWLVECPGFAEFSLLDDPIRTRAHFLDLISADQREKVLRDWYLRSKSLVEGLRGGVSQSEQPCTDELAEDGLLCLAEARHAWLRRMLAHARERAALQ
jgi:DNA-binding PadR family transcriptional regulator